MDKLKRYLTISNFEKKIRLNVFLANFYAVQWNRCSYIVQSADS